VSLGVTNLPNHVHAIPSLSGTASGGNHRHQLTNNVMNGSASNYSTISVGSGSAKFYYDGTYYTGYSGNLSLSVTTTASSTTACTNCNGTAFSTQDAYVVVYIWKRTK
jgi:hypothetical protein